jgi:hypothetical protein
MGSSENAAADDLRDDRTIDARIIDEDHRGVDRCVL